MKLLQRFKNILGRRTVYPTLVYDVASDSQNHKLSSVRLNIFLDQKTKIVDICVKIGLVQQEGFKFSISVIGET